MAIKFSPKEPAKEAAKGPANDTAKPSSAKAARPAKPAQPADDLDPDAAQPGGEREADEPGDLFKAEPKPAGRKQKFRS